MVKQKITDILSSLTDIEKAELLDLLNAYFKKKNGGLLGILYEHLNNQQEVAKIKWEQSQQIEKSIRETGKAKDNPFMREYNREVDAIGKTIDRIKKIEGNSSGKQSKEEVEEEHGDLVD